jgi:RimK family alpha-L-glutamate ligase
LPWIIDPKYTFFGGVKRGWELKYHAGVRLLLLTARPELQTNRRLEEAAQVAGVEAVIADATQVTAVSGAEPSLRLGSEDLLAPAPQAVLARVGNWRPESVIAALEVVVARGVVTPNPPGAIRVGRDHWRTIAALAAAGLPVPITLAGADPEQLAATAASRLGFPVVVKQRRSRMGVGVIRCLARDHLEAVLDSLWRMGDEVVVQSYVPSDGRSLRLLVVGDEVVAAVGMTAPNGDWRSNAARGGEARPRRPGGSEAALARAAARTLGLGVCGVDLLPGETTVVVEVNPTPGFLHLEAATGVDVAAAIVDHTVRCAQAG